MSEVFDVMHERIAKEPHYIDDLWKQMSTSNPELMHAIALHASSLYPQDIEARQRATRLAIIASEATRRPNYLASIEVLWEQPEAVTLSSHDRSSEQLRLFN